MLYRTEQLYKKTQNALILMYESIVTVVPAVMLQLLIILCAILSLTFLFL